jgi:hypothetical protein
MFFQFAAWHQGVAPNLDPSLASIEALFQLHPRTLMEALELFYATRAVPAGYPNYAVPAAFQPGDIGAGTANLRNQIVAAPANMRFDHAMYGYLVENTHAFEIFDRVVREYEAGERFETPDPATALWLRTTEALFYRDLPSGGVIALTSWLRPDLRSIRRNTYYRLLGLDLNHGLDGNRAYPFDKPQAANRDFVPAFEAFLREVWRGVLNAANAVGPNETDNAAIADHVRRLREMLLVRRNNGNLVREEFWSVVTMSWFHLALAQDTPVVRALKADAESPGDRLRKIGERVGVPIHARADNYFNMAFPISNVLTFIETDPNAADPAQAPGYYMPGGPNPQLPADMRTIITHWSAATGRDIKATRVTPGAPPPSGAARPQLMSPGAVPALPVRRAEVEVMSR